MYATKPLSTFKSHPEAAGRPPPEGRNSGYLVVKDGGDDGDGDTCCWGACGGTRVRELPFPQNRVLTLRYTEQHGESSTTYCDAVVFVPILDQPLSANRYYAVIAKGKDKGLVRTCSKEQDMRTCCFCRCIKDVKPKPFDPNDIYQQMEIIPHKGRFTAKAVADDGFPYFLYRKRHWRVYASKPKHFELGEAVGLSDPLRSRPPEAGLPATAAAAAGDAKAVGKWYCPFFFVKEGGRTPEEQMERAMFYAVELEQRWEAVHERGDAHGDVGSFLRVEAARVQSKRVLLGGGNLEARHESRGGGDGYVWFRGPGDERVGVGVALWERMRWEEYRAGWVDEEVVAAEKRDPGFVLVERFVVRRMDGSVVVVFDFRHSRKVRD